MSSSYRWVILASVTALQVSTSAAVFTFGPLAPFLQEDMGISRAQVGLFTSAIYLGGMTVSLPAGWLTDRLGVRRLLVLGPLIQGVFFALFPSVSSFHAVFWLVALSGVGYGFMNPVVIKALLNWFTARDRATAVSIKQTGVTAGAALAAAILPSLALVLSWRSAVPLVGLAVVGVGIACLLIYRNPPLEVEEKRAEQRSKAARASLRKLLTNRNMVLLGVMSAFLAIVHFSIATYLVLFLKESRSFSAVVAGSYLAATQMGATVGRVVWAVVSDRLLGGRRKIVFYWICLLAAALTLVMALLTATMPRWLLLPLVMLLGSSALAWQGVYLTFCGELAGKEQAGTAIGMAATMGYVGIIVGPPLFGLVVDVSGTYTLAWLMLSLSAIVAFLLLLPVKETRPVPAVQPVVVVVGGNPGVKDGT